MLSQEPPPLSKVFFCKTSGCYINSRVLSFSFELIQKTNKKKILSVKTEYLKGKHNLDPAAALQRWLSPD